MTAIDQFLSGEESIVRIVEEDHGILEAERFVSLFNNACLQFDGFEDTLTNLTRRSPYVLAPITNLSHMEN